MIKPQHRVNAKGDDVGIWMFSDVHDNDTRNEIGLAAQQMDGESWTHAINGGDIMVGDGDGDGLYQRYIDRLNGGLNIHSSHDVYTVIGNHDKGLDSSAEGTDFFFKKHLSPITGDNSNHVNQPTTPTGNYKQMVIPIGKNMVVITLGDANSGLPPGGEDGLGSGSLNYRASGNIDLATWVEFKAAVAANKDKIIIAVSHHGIFNTVIGTGFENLGQGGASWRDLNHDPVLHADPKDYATRGYISRIGNVEGAYNDLTGESDTTNEIAAWFTDNGKYIDLFCNGHYHTQLDDEWQGFTEYAEVYGTKFLNIGAINTEHHNFYTGLLVSRSRIFQIKGRQLTIKSKIHKDPNGIEVEGEFLKRIERKITLKTKFIS